MGESVTRRLGDDTAWPVPGEKMGDLERCLRYGVPDKSCLLEAASVINAYSYLISLSLADARKKLALIKKAAARPTYGTTKAGT